MWEWGEYCYFRYENINSVDIAQVKKQELIFYFEFTYGAADIYGSLFETGNNGVILNNLPSQYRKDFKGIYSNQYLRIKLVPGIIKYTLDSVLVLGTIGPKNPSLRIASAASSTFEPPLAPILW